MRLVCKKCRAEKNSPSILSSNFLSTQWHSVSAMIWVEVMMHSNKQGDKKSGYVYRSKENRVKVKAWQLSHSCPYCLAVAALPCLAMWLSHTVLWNSLRYKNMLGINPKTTGKEESGCMPIVLCCLVSGPENRPRIILFSSTDIANGYFYAWVNHRSIL